MSELLATLRTALVGSPMSTGAEWFLRKVPGAPPITQTVHILGVSVVMGSIVLLNMRTLGIALPSYSRRDLAARVMPWLWWALPFLAASGLMFIFARPNRYLRNPVVGIKFGLLIPALLLTLGVDLAGRRDPEFWDRSSGRRALARAIAGVSLLLWITIVLAGRWIAYAEYLFPPD